MVESLYIKFPDITWICTYPYSEKRALVTETISCGKQEVAYIRKLTGGKQQVSKTYRGIYPKYCIKHGCLGLLLLITSCFEIC